MATVHDEVQLKLPSLASHQVSVTTPPLLGEVTHYVANIGKAQTLLGYTPTVPLAEGLARAVAWSRAWAATHG